MAWTAIISSVLVLWFASLCKIFHESLSSSKAAFLNDGAHPRRKNVLLVIAHPDDESMFFAPVINYLISRDHNLRIMCMSTGNADGMGCIRKEELYLASAVLKIPAQQVKTLDHPDLQDGFGKVWNWNLLASIIEEETRTHFVDLRPPFGSICANIITFDNYGISGHCNHCDVHQGVRKLLQDASGRHLEAWEIVSPNILRKYIGPVDIWLSILFSRLKKDGQSYCLLNLDLRKSYAAMAQHSSQWVWFRKLFVTFSSCTYVQEFYKKRKQEENVIVIVIGDQIPMYGSGASLTTPTGMTALPVQLMLEFTVRSRAHVLGKLVKQTEILQQG
ncbi:N-acetylglucosaminylphosphatidylinositol de-N-acetylase family protein [Perilla frutescens var. frutescens]|nr:N-acetylglucosaminylphosphatidylinositol de-N-acetylase family protein [Perilla frutescens var. frutescens]